MLNILVKDGNIKIVATRGLQYSTDLLQISASWLCKNWKIEKFVNCVSYLCEKISV